MALLFLATKAVNLGTCLGLFEKFHCSLDNVRNTWGIWVQRTFDIFLSWEIFFVIRLHLWTNIFMLLYFCFSLQTILHLYLRGRFFLIFLLLRDILWLWTYEDSLILSTKEARLVKTQQLNVLTIPSELLHYHFVVWLWPFCLSITFGQHKCNVSQWL